MPILLLPPPDKPLHIGLPWGDSPVDLLVDPDSPESLQEALKASGLGWASGILLVSTLALLLFNSHALANWADQLPATSTTAPLVNAADGWHGRADALGLNLVVDGVARMATVMRETPWPGTRQSPPPSTSKAP